MSNRNEDRLGVNAPNAGEAPPQVVQNNNQPERGAEGGFNFNFATPTEHVELPSKGVYYPPNHPLRDQETIEVRHMTTKEEDILNSQTLIKNGKVFDKLLSSVIVDKRIRPESILLGDKNAIIIALRIHNYDRFYEPQVTCPNCGAKTKYEFDLAGFPVHGGILLGDAEDLDLEVEPSEHGTFFIKNLPVTGWTFEVKPVTGVEEKSVSEKIKARRKRKLEEATLSTQINSFTVSVEGVSEPGTIIRAINVLPAKDSKILRRVYDKIVPKVDMSQEFLCDECGHSEGMDLPFTAEFFWSK
jgi:hypothetical protein